MNTLVMVGVRTLGRALALHFAARNWQVVCAARTRGDVEALAADVDAAGGHGVPVVCDIGDRASLDALVSGRAASMSPTFRSTAPSRANARRPGSRVRGRAERSRRPTLRAPASTSTGRAPTPGRTS